METSPSVEPLEGQTAPRPRINPLLLNVGLMVFGLGLAGVVVLIIFALYPQFRPGWTTFTVAQGDIFFNQAKWIKPPEDPAEVLATYWIGWDADGFRIPSWQVAPDQYKILAIGDSFTEAPNAAHPWTDVLAEKSGLPVRNLAYRGFGPVEEAAVLENFGVNSAADVVIIGYFEGNDLSNALTAHGQPVVMPAEIKPEQRTVIATDLTTITERDERYPMQVVMNGIEHDIAFFEPYIWGLNADQASIKESRNMQLTGEYYRQMRELLPDKCLVVAYFPTKGHVYLPYLKPEYQPILLQKAERFSAVTGEPLASSPAPETTFDGLLTQLANQRDVFKKRIERLGFVFFDLTPVLQTAAAQGEMLYYTYDTHWNQAGHDLVGAAIADFLKTKPCES